MKKLLLTLVVLMGVSATFASNRLTVNSDLKVKSLSGLKFKVLATNLTEKSIIQVKDLQGYTLYKEVVEAGQFAKIFDLKNLPDGSYKVVVTTGGKSIEEPIEIQTEVKRVISVD